MFLLLPFLKDPAQLTHEQCFLWIECMPRYARTTFSWLSWTSADSQRAFLILPIIAVGCYGWMYSHEIVFNMLMLQSSDRIAGCEAAACGGRVAGPVP